MFELEENRKQAKIEKDRMDKVADYCDSKLAEAKTLYSSGQMAESFEVLKSLISIAKTNDCYMSLRVSITCQAAIYLGAQSSTASNIDSINTVIEYYQLSLKYIMNCDDYTNKQYMKSIIIGLCHAKLLEIDLRIGSPELKNEILSSEAKITKHINDMNCQIQAINKYLTMANANINKNLLETAHCSQYCLQYYCAYLKIYHAQLKEKKIKPDIPDIQDIQDIQDSSNSYAPSDALTNKIANSLYIESFKLFHELSKNTNDFGGKNSFHLRSCFMHLVLFNFLQEKNIENKDKADEGIELSKRTCKELNVYSHINYLHDYLPLSDKKDAQGQSLFSEVIAGL